VLGVVVLGEQLSALSWLGAAVVLVALVMMVRVAGAPAPVRAPSAASSSGRKSAVERPEMSPREGENVWSSGREGALQRPEMAPREGENVCGSRETYT
jgi:hypothetical protein